MSMKLPVILGVGVIAAIGGYFYMQPPVVKTTSATSAAVVSTASRADDYTPEQLAQMTPETLIDMQTQAFTAVVNAANDVSEASSLNERPDYISPAEWVMLSSVASQKPNPDAELVRLVNLVRFNKQLELLQQTTDDSERKVLTEAVLTQLPKRIENKEMSVERAQSVQLQLIEQLYTDPKDVRERAAQEAERIGATFSIEQS
jgi:hypothetical protein